MAQATLIIPNSTGLVFRQNINAALNALATQNSGPFEPFPTYPGMMWLDTSTNPNGVRWTRNGANDGWVQDYAIDNTARAAAQAAADLANTKVARAGDTMTGTLHFDIPAGQSKDIITTWDTVNRMAIRADYYTLKFVDLVNNYIGFEYLFNGGQTYGYMAVEGPVHSRGTFAGFSFADRTYTTQWALFSRDDLMHLTANNNDAFTVDITGFVEFNERPRFATATPWDSLNFTPQVYNGDAGTFLNGQGDFTPVPGTITFPGGTTNFLRSDGQWAVPAGSGGGGGATWGAIGGNLADQLDLVAALDLKADLADVVTLTGNQSITGDKIFLNGLHAQAAAPVDSPVVWLKDSTGQARANFHYDGTQDSVNLVLFNSDASAVAGHLRFTDTTITYNGESLWSTGNFQPLDYLLKAGGTMTGPIEQGNGGTFLQTVAGAKLFSGPAGNTIVIQAAIPAAASLALRNSAGTDIWGAGAGAITAHIPSDFLAGARIYNASQLKLYDLNGDTPLELGIGYGSGSDRNAYLWNRNNGFFELGTNGQPRFRVTAAGPTEAYHIFSVFYGTVGTQNVLRQLGWNNAVPRWKEVIEGDGTLSMYSYDGAGGAPSRVYNIIGPSMGTNRFVFHGHEVATTNQNNNYRMVVGNYGAFWHMNSTHLYLMLTNSGDQWGSWNALRPMYFDLAAGYVRFGQDAFFDSTIYPFQTIQSSNVNLVLAAPGGGAIYMRPNGAFNSPGQAVLSGNGQLSLSASATNPADLYTFALRTTGAYGGGIVIVDGLHAGGIWAVNDRTLHFGVNNGSGGVGLNTSVTVSYAGINTTLAASGGITSFGTMAALWTADRGALCNWALYSNAGAFRIYDSRVGDRFMIETNGEAHVFGGLYVNGGPRLSHDGGDLRVESGVKVLGHYRRLANDGTAWINTPRVFVVSGDPGNWAGDGDLWAW